MTARGITALALAASLLACALAICGSFDRGDGLWRKKVGELYIDSPEKISAPSEAFAGEAVEVTVTYEDYFSREFLRAETELREDELQLEVNLWFQKWEANYSLPYWMLVREEVAVVFSKPGVWTIRSGDKSVEIEVLPAQGGAE